MKNYQVYGSLGVWFSTTGILDGDSQKPRLVKLVATSRSYSPGPPVENYCSWQHYGIWSLSTTYLACVPGLLI